jgi:hypothetical protein
MIDLGRDDVASRPHPPRLRQEPERAWCGDCGGRVVRDDAGVWWHRRERWHGWRGAYERI